MRFKLPELSGLSILLSFGMLSCGTPANDENKAAAQEFNKTESDLKNQIQKVVYEIPSPSEIPSLLEATGAEFNQSLINKSSKADEYLSRNSKAALNLGVSSADIGYLVSYEKVQEAVTHMNSAKKLADNLGISGAFNPELIQRFENNLSRKDSLSYLLNEIIGKTETYLKDYDRNQLAALIITGSFIEGLYISTALIKTYPKDILPGDSRMLVLSPLIRVVLDQEKSLKDLIRMLDSVENTAPVTTLLKDLRELETQYRILNIKDQMKTNRVDLILSEDTLSGITEKVAAIRKAIIV